MPLIPLNIPAGVYRNGTDLMSQGRWRDVNLVRWHEDSIRPVGGWRQRQSVDLSGTARAFHVWEDNSGDPRMAAATHNKLYSISNAGVVTDITPAGLAVGRVDASVNTAYGGGEYGYEEYGVERQDVTTISPATVGVLDNWGEYLLFMSPDDGKLYEWDLAASTAAQVSNAPTLCSGFMITEERFVVCFGAGGNSRKIQWSDQEDNTTWTAAATNQAGDIELQTVGSILQGIRTRSQALILTTEDAHAITYQGPPFVYGVQRVGTSCGAISRKAAAAVDDGVIWMGRRGFFIYQSGNVNPLPCEVGDYVFSDMNPNQRSKVNCVVNGAWGEIWWFYPSENSLENDRYVIFDYVDGIWSIGTLDRTAGVDSGVFKQPMMLDPDGILYEHEIGHIYGATSPFAETGPISIGVGDNVMRVTDLIPDEKTQGEVQAKFKTRIYPNAEEREYGPFTMSNPTSVRFTGRQVRMRIEGAKAEDWRVGIMRLQGNAGGLR